MVGPGPKPDKMKTAARVDQIVHPDPNYWGNKVPKHTPAEERDQNRKWALVVARAWTDLGLRRQLTDANDPAKPSFSQLQDTLKKVLEAEFELDFRSQHSDLPVFILEEDDPRLDDPKQLEDLRRNGFVRVLPRAPLDNIVLLNLEQSVAVMREVYGANTCSI